MNAFLLIAPIVALLLVGPLLSPRPKGEPGLVAQPARQISPAEWRERMRQEKFRQAMREEKAAAPAD